MDANPKSTGLQYCKVGQKPTPQAAAARVTTDTRHVAVVIPAMQSARQASLQDYHHLRLIGPITRCLERAVICLSSSTPPSVKETETDNVEMVQLPVA
ncbi:hypothetical protein QE152_g7622 [Popillia japonica]|uniref:Uncharacterized protein n=1 Tax=Popillia japonica TaxID=7064 RepID=A0AAW1MER6_POPJA